MPRIPPEYLDCVIYLYREPDLAKEGAKTGGSGFLVAMPLVENKEYAVVYAVTNDHVIQECGNDPAVRLNTQQGRVDVIVTEKSQWRSHPQACDVAVCPIQLSDDEHKYRAIEADFFVRKEFLEGVIGPGDEIFMVGRFINVQGQQRNTPALRFGNVAMLPYEPITDDRGIKQESFLIECRSIPGYSGSPVFVFDPYRYRRGYTFIQSLEMAKATGPWLLGIDWCHIESYEPVFDVHKQGETLTRKKRPELQARSNTSMAGVIPAWILLELLNDEEFVKQRMKDDEEISKKKQRKEPIQVT